MWLKDQVGQLWNLDQALCLVPTATQLILLSPTGLTHPVFQGSLEEVGLIQGFIQRDLEAGDIPLCKVSDALEVATNTDDSKLPTDPFVSMNRGELIGYLDQRGGAPDWLNGRDYDDDYLRTVCRHRQLRLGRAG